MKLSHVCIGLLTALAVSSLPLKVPSTAASNAFFPLPRTVFSIPATNFVYAGPLLDEQHIVYGISAPRIQPRTCVSCGDAPFSNFHMQIYVRTYHSGPDGITVSPPRVLFTGPLGAQVGLQAFHRGWLIYQTYLPGDRWALFARNVANGRQIALDSPRREGTPSRSFGADTDGSTVVWASWTIVKGKQVSVIRSFSLLSGKRHLLIAGGSGGDFSYGFPAVSGNRVVFVRQVPDGTAQVFLDSVSTGQIRPLTPAHQSNGEPAISGVVVVWLHGRLTLGHTHGLVVANLATGRRRAIPHSSAQLPRIAADRYVVFATDYGRTSVRVYDTRTHQSRTITGTTPPGQAYAGVEAGGRAILYFDSNPCDYLNVACRARLALVALSPAGFGGFLTS